MGGRKNSRAENRGQSLAPLRAARVSLARGGAGGGGGGGGCMRGLLKATAADSQSTVRHSWAPFPAAAAAPCITHAWVAVVVDIVIHTWVLRRPRWRWGTPAVRFTPTFPCVWHFQHGVRDTCCKRKGSRATQTQVAAQFLPHMKQGGEREEKGRTATHNPPHMSR